MTLTERRKPDILEIQRLLDELTEFTEPDKELGSSDRVVTMIVDGHAKGLYTLYRMSSAKKGAAYGLSGKMDKATATWRDHRKEGLRFHFLSEAYLSFFWARVAQIDPKVIDYPLNSLTVRKGWFICTET
jgi:hypothetical protein